MTALLCRMPIPVLLCNYMKTTHSLCKTSRTLKNAGRKISNGLHMLSFAFESACQDLEVFVLVPKPSPQRSNTSTGNTLVSRQKCHWLQTTTSLTSLEHSPQRRGESI